jgi:hypothetical protein
MKASLVWLVALLAQLSLGSETTEGDDVHTWTGGPLGWPAWAQILALMVAFVPIFYKQLKFLLFFCDVFKKHREDMRR